MTRRQVLLLLGVLILSLGCASSSSTTASPEATAPLDVADADGAASVEAPQRIDALSFDPQDGVDAGTPAQPDVPVEPDASPDAQEDADQSAEAQPFSEGTEGALVTGDCVYLDYDYAVDILLSCGDERFDQELRLHTFKRHALEHRAIFNDQRLTFRQGQLWFDAYSSPRCISVKGDRLMLENDDSQCAEFVFLPVEGGSLLSVAGSGQCAGLGDASCASHQSTGGYECGGIQHRYLPLVMGDCAAGLRFEFREQSDPCPGEYPQASCF